MIRYYVRYEAIAVFGNYAEYHIGCRSRIEALVTAKAIIRRDKESRNIRVYKAVSETESKIIWSRR